ncbi:MAG: ATP-binding protein, partial [Kangiellaceae bacterium]
KIQNQSCVNIEVSDDGAGIEEKYIPTLFKAFDRQSNQDGNISGAGVGLAIAKMMAEQIGGKVGYKTNQLGGATFWVQLPLAN